MPEDKSAVLSSAVRELSAMAFANEIHDCIPNWVNSFERGRWYAEKYGLTGATAYIKQEWLDERDITLSSLVQQLMEWRDEVLPSPTRHPHP